LVLVVTFVMLCHKKKYTKLTAISDTYGDLVNIINDIPAKKIRGKNGKVKKVVNKTVVDC